MKRSIMLLAIGLGMLASAPAWSQTAVGGPEGGVAGLELSVVEQSPAQSPSDAGDCARLAASFRTRNSLAPSRREQLVQECVAAVTPPALRVAQQSEGER